MRVVDLLDSENELLDTQGANCAFMHWVWGFFGEISEELEGKSLKS